MGKFVAMKTKRPSAKIFLDSDDLSYIDDYNQSNGGSTQSFVEMAVKRLISEKRAEQFLKDQELIK